MLVLKDLPYEKGERGPIGLWWEKGDSKIKDLFTHRSSGPEGSSGRKGDPGKRGPKGVAGKDGIDGKDGEQGPPGEKEIPLKDNADIKVKTITAK